MRPSEALSMHRAALRQLCRRYGFAQPRVFGSVLTRTDTEESDLDLLVEIAERDNPVHARRFGTGRAAADGRARVGANAGFLSPKFRDRVVQQAEPL